MLLKLGGIIANRRGKMGTAKENTENGDVKTGFGDTYSLSSKGSMEKGAITSGGSYGCFSWNPKWLQFVNNAFYFAVLMTITNIFQSGTTNGLMGAVQSSIERRFELTSTQSSWIIVTYEITTVPLAIFVMYVGTVGCHRPKWTGWFLMLSALGCFVYALPHFTTGVYLPGEGEDELENTCRNRTGEASPCEKEDDGSSLQAYMAVFILGRIGLSFGGSGLYNFAVTYLDDSLTRDKFSLYTSLLALAGVVGPALGFILGGYLLTLYTDFPSDVEPGFDENDPRWVGAWWLGYIIAGFGLIATTFPMFGYPRDLPGAEDMRMQKTNEASGTTDDPTLNLLKIDFGLRQVPKYLKDLFTNLSFDCLALYVCCDMIILSGMTVFGPKYVEVLFSLTTAQAGMTFGLLVVPAGAIGALSGGIIIERLKMTYESIVKTEFIVSVFVTLLGVVVFLVHCDQVDFAGVNIEYTNESTSIDLIDPCNMDCMCEDMPFSPVCSHENVQYFSACHAGCADVIEMDDGSKEYYNCSCISDVISGPQANTGVCTTGKCSSEVAIFSVFIFFCMTGLFMCEAMNISSTIRVVPNSHRLFAMMVEGFIVRFLGSTPGPVLFGVVFDEACLLFYSECGGEGSCFHYDNRRLGLLMLATCVSAKLLSCIFMFLAWQLYKPPPLSDDDEDDEKKISQKDKVYLNNEAYMSDESVTTKF